MLKIQVKSLVLICFVLLSSGCVQFAKKYDSYPKMYEENPTSILVVPAINNSTASEATDYFSTTIAQPLTFHGYYVPSTEIVNKMFNEQGILDGRQLRDLSPLIFKEKFGVDAILFVQIDSWDTSYFVLGGNVKVGMQYELISSKTGDVLWKYKDNLTINTGGENRAGGLVGLLIQAVETAVKTATTDYVPIAKQVNFMALRSAPFGKYHKLHDKDREMESVNVTKKGK